MTLTLYPAAECRSLYAERAAYARQLRGRGMSYAQIASMAGYRDRSGAWRVINNRVDLETVNRRTPVTLSGMQCVGHNGAFAGWAKTPKGDYIVIRSDKPGECRRARTSIDAMGVAMAWLKEEAKQEAA